MSDYSVFGGCLRSEQLLFPELPFSDSETPHWSLHIADEPCERRIGEMVGAGFESNCEIVLYRIPNGFRLWHSCTGDFDIIANGSRIVWYPCDGAKLEMGRIDVLGRVLSVALHMSGLLTLHGSAVAFEQGVVAFLAPKHHGKSTLAAALLRAGARLVSDDTVAVEPNPPAAVRSGVHAVRLCSDSAEKFIRAETPQRFAIDGKHVVDHKGADLVLLGQAPLSAIYLLQPVLRGVRAPAASRTRQSVSKAAISILAHVKIGSLLGKAEASIVFDRAVTLAHYTPVYRLEVVRDFDQIDDVVDTILSWHGGLTSVGV
jgi:hypothetical protein